ncbi:MAG: hypothetical protein A2157_07025 [Deltaproteobacteria bacterium RBG_16_47_11]|nr:MAG: hypothetical protein A2157_07025 [Deltaproteobacteria bacterium RBG_16_47_11]
MARLYVNENFPLPVVEELGRLGHDVLTMHEAGQVGESMLDEAVLSFSKSEGRALLSLNRKHFIRLHKMIPDHPGIIVCSFDSDFAGMARRVHEIVESIPQVSGRLFRINRPLRG